MLVMRILVIKMSLQSQCFVSQMQLKASLVIICLCFTRSIISFSFFHQSSFFLPSQLLFEQIIIIPRDNVGNVFEYCDVTSFLLLSFFPFFNTVSVIKYSFSCVIDVLVLYSCLLMQCFLCFVLEFWGVSVPILVAFYFMGVFPFNSQCTWLFISGDSMS